MSVLDQCMDIIQFSSGDWPEEELYGLVGHSYRVMAKAKNYDELVVGLMHAFYAASSITRERYYKEMFRGDYEWRTALELFVPPLPDRRFKARKAVSEEYLLGLNMPRFLSEADRNAWVLEQTTFTPEYGDYIWKIAGNRIARNVMIHKLEDMLDVLRNPGQYEDESGPQYYVLPWKKHRVVPVNKVNRPQMDVRIPGTDDALLLRKPTEEERKNLIDKYSNALSILRIAEDSFPVPDSFTPKGHLDIEVYCRKEFWSWLQMAKMENRRFEEEDDDEYVSQELPF